jgi:hypothetical protein
MIQLVELEPLDQIVDFTESESTPVVRWPLAPRATAPALLPLQPGALIC